MAKKTKKKKSSKKVKSMSESAGASKLDYSVFELNSVTESNRNFGVTFNDFQ